VPAEPEGRWEFRLCAAIACLFERYYVRRRRTLTDAWLVVEAEAGVVAHQYAPAPYCPRCGRELMLAGAGVGLGQSMAP
jgi:hypothetical protein